MNFKEYMFSLPNDRRLNILNHIEKHGDPNTVLNELFEIIPCVQNKKLDIRINQNFLLWFEQQKINKPAQIYLIQMNTIKYYYHSVGSGGCSKIGLIKNDDKRLEFSVWNSIDAIIIANTLKSFVTGFENITPYTLEEKNNEVRLPCPIYSEGFYVFRNNSIFLEHHAIFRGYKSKVVVEDINDIIWCAQHFASDPDSSDTYATTLYFQKDKRKYLVLFSDSEYGNFQFVLELKKRVPHLLYGYNEEYKKIHKRNPDALMAIAKSKIKK